MGGNGTLINGALVNGARTRANTAVGFQSGAMGPHRKFQRQLTARQ
jgi:hypothetical protein